MPPAAAAAIQDEPEPPREMSPLTAFAADVFDKVDKLADKLESQEVKDIVEVIDAAAREAEPLLKSVTTCDLTVSPIPAPLAGAGVPVVSEGRARPMRWTVRRKTLRRSMMTAQQQILLALRPWMLPNPMNL